MVIIADASRDGQVFVVTQSMKAVDSEDTNVSKYNLKLSLQPSGSMATL